MPVSISPGAATHENQDDPVNVDHGTVDLGKRLLGLGARQRQLFEARAQLREGCAQVVRYRVGNIANTMQQLLNLVEHPIDGP